MEVHENVTHISTIKSPFAFLACHIFTNNVVSRALFDMFISTAAPAPFELMNCTECKVTFTADGNPMYSVKFKVQYIVHCTV